MDGLTVIIKKQPQKYLDKLPEPERGRVAAAVAGLSTLSGDIVPLRGTRKARGGIPCGLWCMV